MALVLLVCGALLLGAFARTSRVHPGFDPEDVLGAQLRISESAYPDRSGANGLHHARAGARARDSRGPRRGYDAEPLSAGVFCVTLVRIEGRPTPDGQAHTVQFRRVSPDYFKTMRIPLIRGRDFNQQDGASTQPVTIVSRSFAERFWPGEDPLGRRVERGANPRMHTVDRRRRRRQRRRVRPGGGADVLHDLTRRTTWRLRPTSLVLRTRSEPLALATARARRDPVGGSRPAHRSRHHPRSVSGRFARPAAFSHHAAAILGASGSPSRPSESMA